MSAKAVWNQLPLPSKILLAIPAVIGYVMDVIFNLAVSIPILIYTLDIAYSLPHELTFTKRLDRYELGNGKLLKFALYVCSNLNPFQVGGHCVK